MGWFVLQCVQPRKDVSFRGHRNGVIKQKANTHSMAKCDLGINEQIC